MDKSNDQDISKIYCEKCDAIFDSRKKYEKHLDQHSGISCESCPLDIAVDKLTRLFRRK